MDIALQRRLAKRLIEYARQKSTALADDVLEVPIESYLDRNLWQQEVDRLFKRLPIVACLASELPAPGTYFAQTLVGVPLLVTRDSQGKVNAFLNVCSHRGAKVAPEAECSAKANRFTCPYHAWTYDNTGKLLGVQDPALFGNVDRATHGLTRLQADERLGMVFVILTPGVTMNIDDYLSGISECFGDHADKLRFVGARTVKAGHWKLVVEGHMESYHFSQLHRTSIAPFMMSNCSASDKFGSHNLITFCAKSLVAMADTPEKDWRPIEDDHIQPQFHFFPGTLVTQFREAMLVQMIRPGDIPETSTNRLALAAGANSHIDLDKLDYTARLVEKEDYSLSHDIWQGMTAGARTSVMFGKNELSAHHFHEILDSHLTAG